jgi:hypothetical protein
MRSHLFPALVLAVSVAAASEVSAASRQVLPWVEDYSKALAEARAKNVPIFVEAWAPW